MTVSKSKKTYIIDLNNRRSKWAFFAAIVVSFATFVAVIQNTIANLQYESSFHYFTVLSNLLSATGALFMIPYAVEGIRKKRFSMPKWVCMFQYAGAVCVFITMFCAAVIILPTKGFVQAYGYSGFWLHLVIPILAIILFLTVESGHVLTIKDAILVQIPFWTYSVLYYIMVVIIGKNQGGWSDIYEATSIIPIPVVVIMLTAIGFAVALLLRAMHNRRIHRDIKKLSAQWSSDISPIELRIEAFGLGRYMAAHQDRNEILIPIDIFELMSEKCDVSVQDLVLSYTKGVMDGHADK